MFDNDLGLLARIVYGESSTEPLWVKLGVAEVVLNRVKSKTSNSSKYCWLMTFSKFNTIYDVIYKSGFLAINLEKFKNTYNFISKNKFELEEFVSSLMMSIKAYYKNTNYLQSSLYFSKARTFECKNLIEVKINNVPKAVTKFYKFNI